ncbi:MULTISPECIES: oxygenase MpaB family protein [unclassified Luteococcus]|uniref:oxygenase MpaB family protein n=1 Tax=unclassified Luteococcus TaxID=2639923 RepID=UPI00313E349A
MSELMPGARARLAQFLRDKVAGPDAAERAWQIWGVEGERWFSPDDVIWRVNQDPAMYAGGVCALFLQSLHPGPMAAVAQHDNYQSDPWGRLQRISNHIAVTTYAPIPAAERQFALVRAVHEHVRGTDERGNSYWAGDPELLRWVHDAETWSFLTAYRRWGRGTLTNTEADQYVAQAAQGGERLGATGLPLTVAELEAQLAAYRPDLACTPDALEVVDYLTHRAPLPLVAKPGYRMVIAGGKALLPGWARQMLQLPTGAATVRRQALLGAGATRLVGWALVNPDGEHNRPMKGS